MSPEPTEPPEGQEPKPDEPKPDPEQPKEEPKGQEPKTFDAEYVKQLRKEAAEARTAKNRLEQQVQEYTDRDKSEQEKLAERAEKAEREAQEMAQKLARHEVAAEKKLPGELAELLQGSREEMEARADVLLQHVKTDTSPDFAPGVQPDVPEPTDPGQAHNALILGLTGHLPQQK